MMTESQFASLLAETVEENVREESGERVRVRSFGESGLMTSNEGIVVRIDGVEFQVTVVRR